MYLVVCNIS